MMGGLIGSSACQRSLDCDGIKHRRDGGYLFNSFGILSVSVNWVRRGCPFFYCDPLSGLSLFAFALFSRPRTDKVERKKGNKVRRTVPSRHIFLFYRSMSR